MGQPYNLGQMIRGKSAINKTSFILLKVKHECKNFETERGKLRKVFKPQNVEIENS